MSINLLNINSIILIGHKEFKKKKKKRIVQSYVSRTRIYTCMYITERRV